jgi:hypothetical protein
VLYVVTNLALSVYIGLIEANRYFKKSLASPKTDDCIMERPMND